MSNRSCLIVDDSRVIRLVARNILEELNFDIMEAENGKMALETCEESGMPHVVLLDWNMPEMNGLEFVERVRADARFKDTKVMMVGIFTSCNPRNTPSPTA